MCYLVTTELICNTSVAVKEIYDHIPVAMYRFLDRIFGKGPHIGCWVLLFHLICIMLVRIVVI